MPTTLFSPAQLNAFVANAVPELPADHHNAIVAGVDQHGAHVAALVSKDTLHGQWMLKAAGEYTWTGEKKVGLSLIDSW